MVMRAASQFPTRLKIRGSFIIPFSFLCLIRLRGGEGIFERANTLQGLCLVGENHSLG